MSEKGMQIEGRQGPRIELWDTTVIIGWQEEVEPAKTTDKEWTALDKENQKLPSWTEPSEESVLWKSKGDRLHQILLDIE